MILTETEKKAIRKQLDILRLRLEKELRSIATPTDTLGDYKTRFPDNIGSDSDENATEVEEYTDHIAVENSLETQLADVHAALSRIDIHTYGTCEKCGKDIDRDRLRAYPAARSCVHCS